ncbi:MAG: hypothetical protein VKS61_14510 [Candidatus Sericytochromatia bacterium]|nr:hypothetical protein [Candidatus Sericytochromatia bacterium]
MNDPGGAFRHWGAGTLAARLEAAQGPLPLAEARAWLVPVAEALAWLHARGEAHLGVWSDNVAREAGQVRLGGAVALAEAPAWLARRGLLLPEAPSGWLGQPSDVLAWGLLACEVLTGRGMVASGSSPAWPGAARLAQAVAALPAPWDTVLAGCLAWSPLARWSSAAVLQALAPGRGGPPPAAGATLGELSQGHAGPVLALAVGTQAGDLVSLGQDGALRCWHGACEGALTLGQVVSCPGVRFVGFGAPGHLLAVQADGAVTRWATPLDDGHTGLPPLPGVPQALGGAAPWVLCHQEPAWQLVALGAAGGVVPLPLAAPPDGLAVAFSADGGVLACAAEGAIQVLELPGLKPRLVVERLKARLGPLALSADGALLAALVAAGAVRVWRTYGGACVLAFRGQDVSLLSFSPCGRLLATALLAGGVLVHRLADGVQLELASPCGRATALAFTPDGRHLVVGEDTGEVRLVAVSELPALLEAEVPGGCLHAFAVVPDGSRLFTAGHHEVLAWRPEDGACEGCLDRPEGEVHDMKVSPDGGLLAVRGQGGDVELWSTGTLARQAVLEGGTDFAFGLAFSPDGSTLAAGCLDGAIHVWDVASGSRIAHLWQAGSLPLTLVYAPDGRSLYAGSRGGAVWRWCLAEQAVIEAFEAGEGPVYPVVGSADGRWLAMWSEAGGVRVLERPSGRWLDGPTVAERHPRLALDPAGRWLAIADGEVLVVWPLGGDARRLPGGAPITGLAAVGGDGTLWVSRLGGVLEAWRLPAGELERTLDVEPAGRARAPLVRTHPWVWSGDGGWALRRAGAFRPFPAPDPAELMVSADGAWVGWQAEGALHVRSLGAGTAAVQAVPLPEGAVVWALAPGGQRWLCRAGGLLWLAGVAPGAPLVLPPGEAAGFTTDGGGVFVRMGRELRLLDAASGACLAQLEVEGDVTAAGATARGSHWVVATAGGWIEAYDLEDRPHPLTSRYPPGRVVQAVAHALDGRHVALATRTTVDVWDGHGVLEASIALPAGQRLAVGWHGPMLVAVAWDAAQGEATCWRLEPPGFRPSVSGRLACEGLAFAADGRLVALEAGGHVVVREAVAGGLASAWTLRPSEPTRQPVLDPTGRWVASCSERIELVTVYDAGSGLRQPRLQACRQHRLAGAPRRLACCARGEHLGALMATPGGAHVVVGWEVATGEVAGAWLLGPQGPTALALAPGGGQAAVGVLLAPDRGSVVLGSLAQDEALGTLEAHRAEVTALGYDRGGGRLASGDAEGGIACWVTGGWRLAWEARASEAITALAFTPDGRLLLARDRAGGLWGWRVVDGGQVLAAPPPLRPPWAPGADTGLVDGLAATDEVAAVALVPAGVRLLRLPP